MADEVELEVEVGANISDIVTEFLLKTCRLRPQLTRPAVQAAACCAALATEHPPDDTEADVIPLTTGSVAEFYIEPMLPLVGDVDVMHHLSTHLAIPRGHPPPTQLPAEFSDYVQVFEIVDSHLSGYVYLQLRYFLSGCIDDGTYCDFNYDNEGYLPNPSQYTESVGLMHGPAEQKHYIYSPRLLSIDFVPCMRCLSWPPQAADWPTRQRNHGWPDSATVDRVVSNGCDVVGVAHRLCRQNEWMSKHQWRLSFSRAEIVLLNSWMPVQQIVYHMLRFFFKTKRLLDSDDDSKRVVSNYHIKTLMLWASELKPTSWWTESSNLVRICVELLHTLSVCLTDKFLPQYFINNCNLVDDSVSGGTVASELMSVDEVYLSTWFLCQYIRKCAQLYVDPVLRLFDDASSFIKLHDAVLAIVDFRWHSSQHRLWHDVSVAEFLLSLVISDYGLTVRSCVCCMNDLINCHTDLGLSEYFSAATLLYVAYKISRNGFDDNLMDVLTTVLLQLNDTTQHCSKKHRSTLHLNTAVKLMKLTTNELRNTMQLIEIGLSKAYLHRALGCKDSDSYSIYCLANVYLAVLYYTTGQYQTAIDHCTLVTRSQDHSQCSSHVVQGELLPKIDDDIDNVLGLTVFYQYVLSTALNQQQQNQYVSVFTTELFAYYLQCSPLSVTQCRQVTQMSLPDVSQRYATSITDIHNLFTGDVLVFKLLLSKMQAGYGRSESDRSTWTDSRSAIDKTDLNTSELVELLQRSAVEHLTTYRQLEARNFGSVATIVTTDFEALYAYKHGDYQRCLQLSTQNVHTLLHCVRVHDIATFPVFIQLLDDDIVSLTALTLIVNPKCRHQSGNVGVTQLTLSLYLTTQCQLKLRHSVTSLTQTLDYIQVARRRLPISRTLDQLTLKLCKSKVKSLTYSE